ncbi:MAG: hypothetical protein R3E09_01010 [Novosphingobium sp.]|nr:hypothetical protein [Novosphingobium sp.]
MAETHRPGRRSIFPARRRPAMPQWSKDFLSELAATSNVSASARKAGIATATAYDTRRSNPEFNRKWHDALCEGYDHLEMELLHRLRTGEVKPSSRAKRGVRSFDNATAFRLLAVHRETVARQRAVQDNESEEEILASIDRKLANMRERWLAAHGRSADDED